MPRIQASTVVEHHARQRRALLDAARELLGETSQAPSMGAVGHRAGLARSSVYQYFDSRQDLLAAVVADVLPDWAGRVQAGVEAAATPAERVWAYVEANVRLFAGSENAVAQALIATVDPQVLQQPMRDFHARLQVPLRTALAELGEPDPQAMADLIEAAIVRACRDLRSHEAGGKEAGRLALSHLRRLLAPFLGLQHST